MLLLAAKVTSSFDELTRPERVKVLILDDSIIPRNRSKNVIVLEWIRRNQNDQKTYGELFYMFCDDIQDMDLTNALTSLMALFMEHVINLPEEITGLLKSKVDQWMSSQARFIQALFGNLIWES